MNTIYTDRLTQARAIRKIKAVDLASALQWSPVRLSRVEGSVEANVTDEELVIMGSVLNFPAAFFVRPPAPELMYGGILHRRTKRTNKSELSYWDEMARFIADFALDMHERRSLPPVMVPTFDYRIPLEVAARQVRNRFGIELDEPIEDLTLKCELAGIVVVHRKERIGDSTPSMGRSYGASAWLRGLDKYAPLPVIMLNSIDSWERYRLTIAHELGHLVCHTQSRPAADDAMESQAFAFASELLAPIEYVVQELPSRPTLNSLLPIKRKWGISIGALLKHLEVNHVLDEGLIKALQKQLYTRRNPKSGKTWGATEPGYDERAVEQPRMLQAWVEKFYGRLPARAFAHHLMFVPEDLLTLSLSQEPSMEAGNVVSLMARRGGRQIVGAAQD